jgi:hypothetical protein
VVAVRPSVSFLSPQLMRSHRNPRISRSRRRARRSAFSSCSRRDTISARRSAFSVCNAKIFAGVGGIGTITREGGGCGGGDVDIDGAVGAVVDAEKEDGEAYGGDSDDVCDWSSSDAPGGEDRFDVDLAGHVESLLLSLPAVLSSLALGRRALPLVDSTAGRDLTVDAVVDPDGDKRVFEVSVPELPTVPLPEADTGFNVDGGTEGFVSVRVEDPLEDGEPEEGALACREMSEEVRERFGRGGLGNGSVGGGELVRDSTRLVCDEVGTTTVDGDFKRFGGDVADSACVAVIDSAEAPSVVDACKLELTDDAELAAVNVRESEAARARSLDGA